MRKRCFFLALLLLTALLLTACMRADVEQQPIQTDVVKPEVPQDLRTNDEGVPILKVYDVESESIAEMDLETYVTGVLAGAMNAAQAVENARAGDIRLSDKEMGYIDSILPPP